MDTSRVSKGCIGFCTDYMRYPVDDAGFGPDEEGEFWKLICSSFTSKSCELFLELGKAGSKFPEAS